MKLKHSAVAGSFYPADPEQLSKLCLDLLASNPCPGDKPNAIIVPHAGFIYSGRIAALAYNRLQPYLNDIKRIFIFGPAHREGFDYLAALDASLWRTPLGDVHLDRDYTKRLVDKGWLQYFDKAHQQEHSLEVQLPLLQSIGLQDIPIIPIVVGRAPAEKSAALMQLLLEDEHNLLVISSDLSHFQPSLQAEQTDRNTIAKITALDSDISPRQACGCYPLNALLQVAEKMQRRVEALGYCHSGDSNGNKDSVVGYSAFALTARYSPPRKSLCSKSVDEFIPKQSKQYTATQKIEMLTIARQAIQQAFSNNNRAPKSQLQQADYLQPERSCFVSLKAPGKKNPNQMQLRGCIGNLKPRGSLFQSIRRNANLAAFEDHRFSPLQADELDSVVIEISILSPAKAINVKGQAELLTLLKPGVDGLILSCKTQQATFLPSVWQQLPDPQQFVAQLKIKAGLKADFWSKDMRCFIYQSINFSEQSSD